MFISNGFLGSEKFLVRYEDMVRLMTVEELYLYRRKRQGDIRIYRDGKWVPVIVNKSSKHTVRKITADGKEFILGSDTTLVTDFGEAQLKDITSRTKLILDEGKPRKLDTYNAGTCTYAAGLLVGLMLRYGIILDLPYDGLNGIMILRIENERIIELIEYGVRNIYNLGSTNKVSFQQVSDNVYRIVIKSDRILGFIQDLENRKDGTAFDLNILLRGHRFCTGFIEGYLYKEKTNTCPMDLNSKEFEIIQRIAEVCGKEIVTGDGCYALDKLEKKTLNVQSISDPYETTEDLYYIKVKDPLFPYFSVKGRVRVKG